MGKFSKIEFTAEQTAWMREHYATTKNQDCCDYLGVSMRTMIRFARSLGLVKDPDYVRGLWAENCKKMATLNRWDGNAGKKNLLKYGKKYRFRKGETLESRIGTEAWNATKEKIRTSRNDLIRRERLRIKWGLEQQTKLNLVRAPRVNVGTRYCLKKRGYIIECRGARVAYYTPQTNRYAKLEQTAISRGIDILPYAKRQ